VLRWLPVCGQLPPTRLYQVLGGGVFTPEKAENGGDFTIRGLRRYRAVSKIRGDGLIHVLWLVIETISRHTPTLPRPNKAACAFPAEISS
jgi:hypothetical protein